MKVKQLIKLLEKFDGELEVIIPVEELSACVSLEKNDIRKDMFYFHKCGEIYTMDDAKSFEENFDESKCKYAVII